MLNTICTCTKADIILSDWRYCHFSTKSPLQSLQFCHFC